MRTCENLIVAGLIICYLLGLLVRYRSANESSYDVYWDRFMLAAGYEYGSNG